MITRSRFQPAWWLPGPHLQTLWPALFRPRPALDLVTERLELPDGDFLDIARCRQAAGPRVLILHGLEGSIHSHYAGGLMRALQQAGFAPLFMHFRGCSGEPNRLPRGYHSGETGDLGFLVGWLAAREGAAPAAAVGFSLGGNVLLKWLGEQGPHSPLQAAAAVSVPFRLADAARRMNRGFSRYYQAHLLKHMKRAYRKKFSRIPPPLSVDIDQMASFRAFDEQVTAPLHGFSGADDYYARSSSRPYLGRIETPTLILHARDDPFMYPETPPGAGELSPAVTLEGSRHGGHVGFVAGRYPWRPRYWLEQRITAWLREQLPAPPGA